MSLAYSMQMPNINKMVAMSQNELNVIGGVFNKHKQNFFLAVRGKHIIFSTICSRLATLFPV